jgi:hypothetical protein
LGSYTRSLLVSQDRRHFFVTPWSNISTVGAIPNYPVLGF